MFKVDFMVKNELLHINTRGTKISKQKGLPTPHQSYETLTRGNGFLAEGSMSASQAGRGFRVCWRKQRIPNTSANVC